MERKRPMTVPPQQSDRDLLGLAAAAGGGQGLPGASDPAEAVQRHMKAFLDHVDARELRRRISDFRALNFRALSYGDIHQAILDVILFETPTGKMSVLLPSSARYSAGTLFFRVRAIPEDDRTLPLRSMSKVSDCWEPPPEVVEIGRLNRKGESLLYTSPIDPMVAVDELKIDDDEWCSLIVYEAIDDVKVAVIGDSSATDGFDEDAALKLEMMQDFLRHEFTRDVGSGTEYLYRISEVIAKSYFDLPPERQDAWCYPSIVDKSKFNVAFRPQNRGKLRLVGVQLAKPHRLPSGERGLRVYAVAKPMEGSDDLAYFRIGSPEQREIFPEVTTDAREVDDVPGG